jgi:ArsR family transcriptional regulator
VIALQRYDQTMEKRQFTLITKALADPRRFEILKRIAVCKKETSCLALKEKVGVAPATLSHHLKELSNAGLIRTRRDSKFMYLELRRDIWSDYLKQLRNISR